MRRAWFVFAIGCGSSNAVPDASPPEIEGGVLAGEDVLVGVEAGYLAVDATHVYFTSTGGGISRVVKTGGTLEPIASAQRGPTSLDASTNELCWVNSGTHAQDFLDGSIRCAPKTGGDRMITGAYFPSALAIDGSTIYWTEIDGESVRSIGVDGSNAKTIDTSPTSKLGIALTPTTLVWIASGAEADVVAMNRTTGTKTPLSTAEYAPMGLALDGVDVYWLVRHSLSDDGALRVSRAGGAPSDIVADEYYPQSLVKANRSLYWASKGRIRAIALDGGTVTTLADRGSIAGLASDGEYLYWSEPARRAIVRLKL